MSSPARYTSNLQKSVVGFPNISNAQCRFGSPIAPAANALTACSFEFVAKPEQAAGAPLFLPAAIQSGLEDIAGFAGSMVMVSDQEARLITVILLWSGTEARRSCERSMRRVRALLAPYLDRCLRIQNLQAHLPPAQDSATEIDAEIQTEAASAGACFINEETITQEANVCAA